MALMEKITNLTPEQQDKEEVLAHFETEIIPMSDDDMEAVAGGVAVEPPPKSEQHKD